jgi:glycosyltransferase involved in cell wall biosynthesis
LRILIYDWSLFNFGGGQKFNCKIIDYLSKKYDVDILTLFPINLREIEKTYNVDFSKVNKLRFLFKKRKLNPSFLHLISFKKVSKISKDYDFFFNAEAHETIKSRARYNLMYCHFFEQKCYRPSKNFTDFFKLVFVYIFKSMLKNYAKKYNIYCNSNYTKHWLRKKWKVDAKVIYPPIDIPKKKIIKKENIILSIGRLTPDKNYEFVIYCFKKLYETNKNYRCIICGIKYGEAYYQKLLRISKNYPIRIITSVSDKELNELYDKSKIFIQAKGLNINEKKYPALVEHFGMSAAEAMAHGCIPILLNKGGYKETIEQGKSGFLFNSEKEAVEKLKILTNNEKIRKKMSRNAAQRAKKFSLERMQKEIDAAIKETIQKQS